MTRTTPIYCYSRGISKEGSIDVWYYLIVIVNVADEETRTIWQGKRSRRLPTEIQTTAFRKLGYIDDAVLITDLRLPPGNQLEKLSGDRDGQWSVRINHQWRICFVWAERQPNPAVQTPQPGDAYQVEITNHYG